jgi:ATP-dependent Clp protease protease subunit
MTRPTPDLPSPNFPQPGFPPGAPQPGPGIPGPNIPGPNVPGTTPEHLPWPPSPGEAAGSEHRAWLYRQLLDRRIVLAQGTLDDELATVLCAQLLTLDAEGEEPIQLHLNTPDGEVGAALTVLDALDVLQTSVHALAVGSVGGPCLGVLVAADERRAYPHASFHLSEPRTKAEGSATEMSAHEAQHRRLAEDLYERIARATGHEVEQVRADARKGRYLTAAEAEEYGLIDQVVTRT